MKDGLFFTCDVCSFVGSDVICSFGVCDICSFVSSDVMCSFKVCGIIVQ